MKPIDLSPSLAEAIGRTLMHSIWIGFLLLSMMKLILYRIPHNYSRLRYRVAGLSLLTFTGAMVVLFFSYFEPSGNPGGAMIESWQPLVMAERSADTESTQHFLQFRIWKLISTLYFAGFFYMFLHNCISLIHLRQLKKSGHPAGAFWSGRFSELTLRLGIRRKVTLLESTRAATPGLFGWIKPVVIIPAGMLTQMPFEQVETILIHELYHLKRFDYLVNLLQITAEGLFFYHPAVWLISRTMRVEREHCCDDLVLRSGHPPLLYAQALAGLSFNQVRVARLVTAAGGTGQPVMYRRISRILNQNHMKTNIRERLLTGGLFFAGIAVMVLLNGFSSGISIVKHHGTDPGVISSETINPLAGPELIPGTHATAIMDTVPVVPEPTEVQDAQDIDVDVDVDVEIDHEIEKEINKKIDIKIDREVKEALDEIDWEKIRTEAELAAREASESIDWEAMKKEIEQAQHEALEEIDWEKIRAEAALAAKEASESIDWEEMKKEIEQAQKEAMEEIDWDQMRMEIKKSMEEIDWDQMRMEIKKSMEEIDWEKIRKDMEQVKVQLDSLK